MMKLRPAMKRPYAVLHKNLAEIESHLFDLSSSTTAGIDVAGKIDFLKALLAAEMETQAVGTPPNILHFSNRLKRAEEALRNLMDMDLVSAKDLRNGSMCSCTDDCFDDEAEQEEEQEVDHRVPEPESDEEDSVPEPEYFGPATFGNDKDLVQGGSGSDWSSWEGEDGEMVRAQRCHWFIVAAVVILAAAAAAIGVASSFNTVEEVFLVPT